MKKNYEAPVANVITVEAVEKLALLDERSNDGINTASDDDFVVSTGHGSGSGRPV